MYIISLYIRIMLVLLFYAWPESHNGTLERSQRAVCVGVCVLTCVYLFVYKCKHMGIYLTMAVPGCTGCEQDDGTLERPQPCAGKILWDRIFIHIYILFIHVYGSWCCCCFVQGVNRTMVHLNDHSVLCVLAYVCLHASTCLYIYTNILTYI